MRDESWGDKAGEWVLVVIGLTAVCVVVTLGLSVSVFVAKATYERVTHWEQCT